VRKTLTVVAILLLSTVCYARTNVESRTHIEQGVYKKTANLWKCVYKASVERGEAPLGVSYIGPLPGNGVIDRQHKNGSRNNIIFAPLTTRFNEPIDLIFWYHGLGGFGTRDFKRRLLYNAKILSEEGRNFILIVPEMPWSQNTKTPRSRQGRVFRKQSYVVNFVLSTLRVIGSYHEPSYLLRTKCALYNVCAPAVNDIILIGHSAGGSALSALSRFKGMDWLRPTRIVFSDASYGHWLDNTWSHYKHRNGTLFVVLARKWDKPYRQLKRFLKSLSVAKNKFITLITNRSLRHGDIGDMSLLYAYSLKNPHEQK